MSSTVTTRDHIPELSNSLGSDSNDVHRLIQFINFSVLCGFIAVLGVIGNVVNLVVFSKQVSKSSVQVSLTALAFTDLCNPLTVLWFSMCLNPTIADIPGIFIVPSEFAYLIGFPHSSLVRIKAWITVFVSAERCMCVAVPLKVKQIITPKRTIAAIVIIYLVALSAAVPEFVAAYIDWKYVPKLNRTLLGIVYNMDKLYLEAQTFFLFSVLMFSSFPSVVILTTILIYKLKQTSQWRTKAIGSEDSKLSSKDKLAIRTVVVVSVNLIITLMPAFLYPLIGFIVPEFSISGKLNNLMLTFGSFTFVFDTINSSVNIMFYLFMNYNFRKTIIELFLLKHKK